MEVPGLMACGPRIQRSPPSGFRRRGACGKLGAMAHGAVGGLPVGGQWGDALWGEAGKFGEEVGRGMVLGGRVAGHGHEGSLLAGNGLVTAHTVIFLGDPPGFLDVAAVIQWPVMIAGGKRIFLAAQKESG